MQSTKTNIGLTDQIDNSDVQAKHCQSFSNFATQTKSENCYSQELRNIIIYEKKSNPVLRQFAAKVSLLSMGPSI